jgi:hypothetical protein
VSAESIGPAELLMAAIVVVGGIYILSTSSNSSSAKPNDESSMAFIQCKDFVKDNLKAPSTADLPFLDYQATKVGDNHYIIKSHVDAQNGFGATIRNSFLCDLEWNGIEAANRKNWSLLSLRFFD